MENHLAKCRSFASPSATGPDTGASRALSTLASYRAPFPTLLDVSILVARGGWLDLRSGKHLQEASGTLCRDCREYVGSHLRVDYSTPRALWPLRGAGVTVASHGSGDSGGSIGQGWVGGVGTWGDDGRRFGSDATNTNNRSISVGSLNANIMSIAVKKTSLPPLRVTGMTWERPLGDLARGRALPVGLEDLKFACSFRYFDVEWVSFPRSLLSLSFGQNFDQAIDTVAWPPRLQRLAFGWEFNQSIDGVQWPPGLKRLTFGQSFDRPIHAVSWPLGLEDLTFGGRFNQPIHGGAFPPGLRRLTFGWRFNQPIVEVVWPHRLQRLMFGSLFNQVRILSYLFLFKSYKRLVCKWIGFQNLYGVRATYKGGGVYS